MVVDSVKKLKNVVSEVMKGYTSNSTGGCCGVSLPPEEQREPIRLKRKIDTYDKNEYTTVIERKRTTGAPRKVSIVVRFYFAHERWIRCNYY